RYFPGFANYIDCEDPLSNANVIIANRIRARPRMKTSNPTRRRTTMARLSHDAGRVETTVR
ncbi:MAG TPA: hypothetical protein VHZ02_17170, partial [Acidimicrobiales bacterium]|nr:hypothetical protein [Acidimicrobiales bacterium]